MKRLWLSAALLLSSPALSWAIYGPSFARADPAAAAQACQQADIPHSREMANAIRRRDPSEAFHVLPEAISRLKRTSTILALYPARAFCVHELVLSSLAATAAEGVRDRQRVQPAVRKIVASTYFFYEPDRRWTLRSNPVDLDHLALEHLDSPWGRQAFLMMTQIGWSHGGCQEGTDQFQEVIKRGKAFLAQYASSEVSLAIRLEVANAYATWWYLSRDTAHDASSPEHYRLGASGARQKALALYRSYRAEEVTPDSKVDDRMQALENNTAGKSTYDYFCADYED